MGSHQLGVTVPLPLSKVASWPVLLTWLAWAPILPCQSGLLPYTHKVPLTGCLRVRSLTKRLSLHRQGNDLGTF